MLRILIVCLGCFLGGAVNANDAITSSMLAPLAEKSLLLDITSIQQKKLVAVGERGHVLLSVDGNNWQQVSVPTQETLTSVFFINNLVGWAVGHNSTILKTTNGGNNWHLQYSNPSLQKPLLDIVFKDPFHGVAVGAYGQFLRTIDGGKTWLSEFHEEFLLEEDKAFLDELKVDDEEAYFDERESILPHFNRIISDGRTTYLVGEIGLIAKSNDLGLTWTKFDEIYRGSFFDLSRTHEGNLVVAGLRGHVFRSLKNGTPWQESKTDTTSLLNSIVLSDEGRIFILGNNGVILESHDDGHSFVLKMQPDGKSLIAGVWFNNRIVAVSDVGIKNIFMNSSGFNY
ncbi:WD40/YVTN/BNR-like repeat-containing protein [Pseudocolwellia agarivorans]|uniref:WD40/YVTN/BNR-like repeat-containing protein n=1 Tax=Pseudocolwellia agarivorans TaxID=1911682 RepID=UPI000986CB99|nr:YCF48-related protein [Pseudocolwellia agarivorans]